MIQNYRGECLDAAILCGSIRSIADGAYLSYHSQALIFLTGFQLEFGEQPNDIGAVIRYSSIMSNTFLITIYLLSISRFLARIV